MAGASRVSFRFDRMSHRLSDQQIDGGASEPTKREKKDLRTSLVVVKAAVAGHIDRQ